MPISPQRLRELAQGSTLLRGILDSLDAGRTRMQSLLNLPELDATQAAEFDQLTASADATDNSRSIAALEQRAQEVGEQVERAARHSASLGAGQNAPEQTPAAPAGPGHTPRAVVTAEPTTYQKGRHDQGSYFRDMTLVNLNREGANQARSRLERCAQEVRVDTTGERQERALSTTDTAGGDFVPPLWMVQDFVELARAGRVTADRMRQMTLPGGTDSINIPRLATGTAVAEQTTQNTAVQNTDATTNSIAGSVTTIAGQQVVSVQLIEQSPVNMDEILLQDLAADYAVKADTFAISNNAAGKLGILSVSGINAITYTSGSPTITLLYSKLADAIQQIHTGRLLPADAIVMHPRRWAYFLAAVDTQGRPLVTPYDGMNAVAQTGGVISEGYVGTLQGLPVYLDPNIPINLGAGTNEDRIIIARFADLYLWEGMQRAEAFRETKADQLSVLLRFYNYIALIAGRLPKSISVVAGTGLVAPTF
jgi:HK97 family phage major capsid protein